MVQIESTYLPFIKQMVLFQPLDDEQLNQVAQRLKPRRYRAGTIIFHQGDPGESLYLLIDGRVRISLVHPDGREMAQAQRLSRTVHAVRMEAKRARAAIAMLQPERCRELPASGRQLHVR